MSDLTNLIMGCTMFKFHQDSFFTEAWKNIELRLQAREAKEKDKKKDETIEDLSTKLEHMQT